MQVTRLAHAKINLSLRIAGRRADGYHLLDSLFLPIAFADQLTIQITPARQSRVICRCPGRRELEGEKNLAAQAATAFLTAVDAHAEVDIAIEKRIWTGAGLGGGSSDAAAVLSVLETNLSAVLGRKQCQLGAQRLLALAEALGADVPFFLQSRPQRAQGIGSQLTPLTGVPAVDLVLVNPGVEVSTKEVYHALGIAPGTTCAIDPQPDDLGQSVARMRELIVNDLEAPAIRLCPAIAEIKSLMLNLGALAVGMSGSGPTVFSLAHDANHAAALAAKVSEKTSFSAATCRTLP